MDNSGFTNNIKNIIFDFGGVILNISHTHLEEAFRLLGLSNFEELFSQAQQSYLFQQFEKGELEPSEFRSAIKKMTGLNVSDELFDDTWNKIIRDYPPERIELLKSIKGNFNLYLLSNTNQIHYDFYTENFKNEYGFEFHSLFHNTYWSFKRGKRKPDSEAFNDMIINEGISPEETLFVDDSKQNIIAASNLGFKTLYLQNGMEITDFFSKGKLINDFIR